MKYLDRLEIEIGQSEEQDNKIYKLLSCEIEKIEYILNESSEFYNDTHTHSERMDNTYIFEKEYKEKILELLSRIEIGDTEPSRNYRKIGFILFPRKKYDKQT